MYAEFRPGRAAGAVEAPPSKSMGHRMLLCAGLSGGPCTVRGIASSQDMLATLDCLSALGTPSPCPAGMCFPPPKRW